MICVCVYIYLECVCVYTWSVCMYVCTFVCIHTHVIFEIPSNHENIATHLNWCGVQWWCLKIGLLCRSELQISVADLRAHLELCAFPFSEVCDHDLSVPRVVYREALPGSPALSPLPVLPFPRFTTLVFLLLRKATRLLAPDL